MPYSSYNNNDSLVSTTNPDVASVANVRSIPQDSTIQPTLLKANPIATNLAVENLKNKTASTNKVLTAPPWRQDTLVVEVKENSDDVEGEIVDINNVTLDQESYVKKRKRSKTWFKKFRTWLANKIRPED